MKRKVSHRAVSRPAGTLAAGWVAVLVFCVSPSLGYTTKSPEVVQMVDRATNYLRRAGHAKPGGMALIGLALLKNKLPLSEPKMVEVAESIAQSARGGAANMDIYSTGLCIIYLASYDPDKYRGEVETLLRALEAKQKPHGGWGYPASKRGDTSMTQYGVLSVWEAKQAGFKVPQTVINRMATWLLKTQDPSGAWGYQAKTSDTFQPIPQSGVRHSLAAAGLGSTYICAHLLGMNPEVSSGGERQPSALKEVRQPQPRRGNRPKINTNVAPDVLRTVQNRGNAWMEKNYTVRPEAEALYYLYALERYHSFRELAEGKANRDPARQEAPKWYNDGVGFLKDLQAKDGSWSWTGQCDTVVNTAFGTLFLLRSTQKSIQRSRGFGDGRLIGGLGLPKKGEFLGRGGQIVSKPLLGPGPALIAALGEQEAEDLTALVEQFDRLGDRKRPELLTSKHQKRFKTLLCDPSPEKRIAAVRMLVFSGNLDNVPTLIPALKDPDLDVVLATRDGLRRLTRRFGGFDLPDNPTPEDKLRAVRQWKKWYLSIRPDTEF